MVCIWEKLVGIQEMVVMVQVLYFKSIKSKQKWTNSSAWIILNDIYKNIKAGQEKDSYFNPNWHELWKQKKCSSLAPPRAIF